MVEDFTHKILFGYLVDNCHDHVGQEKEDGNYFQLQGHGSL